MSVRPDVSPAAPSLTGSDGELENVRICVEPRLLERLLEALAVVSFPINPQIYHQAGIGYVYADGREEVIPATIVEFPVFSGHLSEVREALLASELPEDSAHIKSMLEDIHSDHDVKAAPDSAPYCRVNIYKQLLKAS